MTNLMVVMTGQVQEKGAYKGDTKLPPVVMVMMAHCTQTPNPMYSTQTLYLVYCRNPTTLYHHHHQKAFRNYFPYLPRSQDRD